MRVFRHWEKRAPALTRQCWCCGFAVPGLLEAAHAGGRGRRRALDLDATALLCPTCHRAHDLGLIGWPHVMEGREAILAGRKPSPAAAWKLIRDGAPDLARSWLGAKARAREGVASGSGGGKGVGGKGIGGRRRRGPTDGEQLTLFGQKELEAARLDRLAAEILHHAPPLVLEVLHRHFAKIRTGAGPDAETVRRLIVDALDRG